MPTPTYDLIESVTLTTSASSVTFSSIPQDYRDLIIVLNPIVSGGDAPVRYYLNNDEGSNYNYVNMRGRLGAAVSSSNTNQPYITMSANALLNDTNGNRFTLEFMDYSATDKHKSTLEIHSYATSATPEISAQASRYASNSAITSVGFELFQGNGPKFFDTGSTFSIYGIAA